MTLASISCIYISAEGHDGWYEVSDSTTMSGRKPSDSEPQPAAQADRKPDQETSLGDAPGEVPEEAPDDAEEDMEWRPEDRFPDCEGCRWQRPGQDAHMQEGGCLYDG